ncbi:hypothetical protein [Amycolatopsis sp. FDAARGOS 1241]|uniref:hypothetical protein n=1 Tax=Amycolatopsis sp. FDAARGOS 1241 TaxID=2778070 RepID=UPI00194DE8DF|nr:hypothetical protein [Amycolatopsis sp. FDAARGOS 1241]QRP45071.1 hypothetical protein I6J71_38760 [Amycolatopsis sp. FDAARGOS 1241]
MSRRAGALAGTIAAAALFAAGCTADDEPSTAPPATFTSVPAPVTIGGPSVLPSSSAPPAGDQANVKRGAQTGEADVDVLVTVDYSAGKVTPPAGVVDVQVGDRVKVRVTSDKQETIDVQDMANASSDVGPGAPQDVAWTVAKAGDTKVTLGTAGTLLVTVHAA